MSFHMPEHVRELQARQIACTGQKAWWPCPSQPREQAAAGTAIPEQSGSPVVSLGPGGSSVAETCHLEEKLSEAIGTPLPSSLRLIAPTTTSTSQIKTSKSHPLKRVQFVFFFIIHSDAYQAGVLQHFTDHITRNPPPHLVESHPTSENVPGDV